jgi:N6-L-threonylcarbamoyladenine synthase
MRILGIETSCDETAAAVVEDGTKVLSNCIASSVDMHAETGGVVPEVAAREHILQISPVIDKAMKDAGVEWKDIDAIAVTHAPGLISSLLVGVNTAQTLAYIHQKPLIPVHHVTGHIYANFLERDPSSFEFRVLILTISGGHNELVLMKGHHQFEVIGETLDDAAGEAFDKIARLLDLGFPGGPIISKRAEDGDPTAFDFPRPMLDEDNKYNFSFSGLKSAVKREVDKLDDRPSTVDDRQSSNVKRQIDNLAASFQAAVIDVLTDKLIMAAEEFNVKAVHLAGGVSANQLFRKTVRDRLPSNIELLWPKKMIYCTDNAAMIASAAYFMPKKDVDAKSIEVQSQLSLT